MGVVEDVENWLNSVAAGASAEKTNTQLLKAILAQQLIQTGQGQQTYLFISDLLKLDKTVTSPTAALAAPVLTFVTPQQPMNVDTLGIGFNSTASLQYSWFIVVQGLTNQNQGFLVFPDFANEIDVVPVHSRIPIPANATVSLYAYNSGGATSDATAQVYMLGLLQSSS
jgi:hypothetical protein